MALGPNLLSANESGIDTDITGWQAGFNSSLSRVTSNFRTAPACGQANCTASGPGVSNWTFPSAKAVTAGLDYTWFVWQRLSTTTGKLGRCMMEFIDGASATIGVRHDSADVTLNNTTYQQTIINFLAPAGAVNVFLTVEVEMTVTNEKSLFDDAFFGLTNVASNIPTVMIRRNAVIQRASYF